MHVQVEGEEEEEEEKERREDLIFYFLLLLSRSSSRPSARSTDYSANARQEERKASSLSLSLFEAPCFFYHLVVVVQGSRVCV
jgi:hypothetical protein